MYYISFTKSPRCEMNETISRAVGYGDAVTVCSPSRLAGALSDLVRLSDLVEISGVTISRRRR